MEVRKGNLKFDEGVAGTAVLVGLIVSLFVIGLLVMIFALMGGSLSNSSGVIDSSTASATYNIRNFTSLGVTLPVCSTASNAVLTSLTVINSTSGTVVPSTNYTLSGCIVTALGSSTYNGTLVNYTYSLTYSGAAYSVINDTVGSIATVTDFFSLFIVIGSMVVLILLTVIIIVAIRQSGMLGETTA